MTMTPQHPRWEEFLDRLEGPEGCNFVTLTEDTDLSAFRPDARLVMAHHDHIVWWCSGPGEHRFLSASAVLWAMGFRMPDIVASFRFFAAHGGHCDCEILFNLDGEAFVGSEAFDS